MTVLIAVTEIHGDAKAERRITWVNPRTIARFNLVRVLREDFGDMTATRVRFTDGDSILIEEAPQCLAQAMLGDYVSDPLLAAADFAERHPA